MKAWLTKERNVIRLQRLNIQWWCEFQPAIGDIFAAKQAKGIGGQGLEAAYQEGGDCVRSGMHLQVKHDLKSQKAMKKWALLRPFDMRQG